VPSILSRGEEEDEVEGIRRAMGVLDFPHLLPDTAKSEGKGAVLGFVVAGED
jgi:hypothetical protein